MSSISELRESLKKIRSMNLSMDSYEELRCKLAVILVKAALKRVFFLQLMNGNLDDLKGAGLKSLVSCLPPQYYFGQPKVPSWFLTEYNRISQIEREKIKCAWFYPDDSTHSKIMSSLNGDLDLGHILDYPDCCVEWHKRIVAKEIEILYQYVIDRYDLTTQNEVLEALGFSRARFFSHRFVQIQISENIEKTVSKFPFIFHIACPACLKETGESVALNEKYEQLALSLERSFHDEIVEAGVDFIKKVEEDRVIFIKEFCETKQNFQLLGKLKNIMKAD